MTSTQTICPLCALPNNCKLVQSCCTGDCWCMQVKIAHDILAQIPVDQVNKSCICQKCASSKQKTPTPNFPLIS
ncbi:MAG: hypothetical protein EOO53_04320 [Gammaproteobacteria bacterium]|nr:MAG: hypothetical protein EOO53_04320 [Gammaproteobacteria bacterium]